MDEVCHGEVWRRDKVSINEVILICYLLCLIVGVSGLTIAVLIRKKTGNVISTAMAGFIVGILVICFYDMMIYYCDYVIGNFSNLKVMRIGNCIIAGTMYLWNNLQGKLISREGMKLLDKMVKKYLALYASLWMVLTLFLEIRQFYALKWLLLSTDIILIILFLAAAIGHIIYASSAMEKKKLYYMLVITAMLIWNYISYFWAETSVYWGNSEFIREPLDLTIIFWLVLNIATLVYVYYEGFLVFLFRNEEAEPVAAILSMEDKLEKVCAQYGLTPREKELTELIYNGKSNKEIAEILILSESTVKTHIYNIFRKMEVKNRVEVICIINEI